ncbi:MAG: ATP-binding cassette domain-containing protein [Acidobacteria bacterium]|nr:ATP-binding cassette domain-containing protein [Acidobacteriota bacterium]
MLSIQGIVVQFKGRPPSVNRVSFDILRGETLGLVGESGCGKTTLARALLGLVPVQAGSATLYPESEDQPVDLARLSRPGMRMSRRHIQMVFQEPRSSLDPRWKAGDAIAEPLRAFRLAEGEAAQHRVRQLLELVGLPGRVYDSYPHELSGGEAQRVAIARSLAPYPVMLVADEPTSALDVSVQAQIMNLLARVQRELHLTCLFISHDLRVVSHASDRVAVMRQGRVIELAEARKVYEDPSMPYTRSLLAAADRLRPSWRSRRD